MAARVSFDTNILVYALDTSAGDKQHIAQKLIMGAARGRAPLPLQTLNELSRTVLQKRLLSPADLISVVSTYARSFHVVSPTAADTVQSIETCALHHLPFWDAMLWATARRAGCTLLLTEDFQDGRTLGGVTFRNPFAMSEAELAKLV